MVNPNERTVSQPSKVQSDCDFQAEFCDFRRKCKEEVIHAVSRDVISRDVISRFSINGVSSDVIAVSTQS